MKEQTVKVFTLQEKHLLCLWETCSANLQYQQQWVWAEKYWSQNLHSNCVSKLTKSIGICKCPLPHLPYTVNKSGAFCKILFQALSVQLTKHWHTSHYLASGFRIQQYEKGIDLYVLSDKICRDEESRFYSEHSSYQVAECFGGAQAPPDVKCKGAVTKTELSIDFWARLA